MAADPETVPRLVRSRRNPLIRALRALAESPAARERTGAFLADGVRLLEEAVRWGAPIDVAITSPRLDRGERGRSLREALDRAAARTVRATDEVVAAILGAPRHQGALARVRRRATTLDSLLEPPTPRLLLLALGVQDPGNLGGMARVAAAAGAAGLLAPDGTVDPWNPKAVRASAGAIFHLPVVRDLDAPDALRRLSRSGFTCVGAVACGGEPYTEMDWSAPTVLVVGGEAAGLPPEIAPSLQRWVTIPVADRVESLNVLSAATLLLFEAARRGTPR